MASSFSVKDSLRRIRALFDSGCLIFPALSSMIKTGGEVPMNQTNPSPEEELSVGRRIQQLRAHRGMTQEDLGKLFHVTRQTVSNWENGVSHS